MKEILGGELDKAFEELGMNAKKTYESKNLRHQYQEIYQVWELSDEDFIKICSFSENEWKDYWGWWRSAEGSNMCTSLSRFNINHHYIKAWDGDSRLEALEEVHGNINHDNYCYQDRKYDYLLQYFCDEIGASQPKNVCALAVDLARINGITMAELFTKFQG